MIQNSLLRAMVVITSLVVPSLAMAEGNESPPQVAGRDVDAPSHHAVLTLEPLPWALGFYGGSFDIAMSEKVALSLGFNATLLTIHSGQGNSASDLTFSGAGIEPGVHFFLAGKAPSGLWVGPKVELHYYNVKTTSTFSGGSSGLSTFGSSNSAFLYGGQVMVGYTHVFTSGFTVQGGVGIGYSGSSVSSTSIPEPSTVAGKAQDPLILAGSLGRVSFAAGWAF